MTDETMTQTPMPTDAPGTNLPGEPYQESAEAGSSVTNELRSLGQHLASALRAATTTEEAESLKGEVRDGMRQLKEQVDEALAASPIGRRRSDEAAPDGGAESGAAGGRMGQVRVELAGALRSLNRVLDRAAVSLEGKDVEPDVTAGGPGSQPPGAMG